MTEPPRALPAPPDPVVTLDTDLLERVVAASRAHPRGRMILPLHEGSGASLHRMLNAIQPHSYVRPHRHLDPPKPESWIVLRGRLAFATFDDHGAMTHRAVLSPDTAGFGIDVEAGIWHGLAALLPDTVLFEAKPGPWSATTDKTFAPWAPAEGSPDAALWLEDFKRQVTAV